MSGDTNDGLEIATELVKYLKSLLPGPPGGPAETVAAAGIWSGRGRVAHIHGRGTRSSLAC